MDIKVVFTLVFSALVQAKSTEFDPNIDIVGLEGKFGITNLETDLFTIWETMEVMIKADIADTDRASNFVATETDANRGKMPGKKLPLAVIMEMEANAFKAGCTRGCLICLSKIKCTAKMKVYIPGRCHDYGGDKKTGQAGIVGAIVDIPEISGFKEMAPMEQFIAQVDRCASCTTGCLKGLANVKCSELLKKWLPDRCASFADKIQKEVHNIKGMAGDR
uniref:Secreted luciferase n=1 Tax=Metridia longa TaxID=114071 RepID=Q6UQE3_9MAXI|nr:secreted luciferase precursor [Metridia longa]BAV53308.1 secreted luciferase [Expression vector pUMLIEP]